MTTRSKFIITMISLAALWVLPARALGQQRPSGAGAQSAGTADPWASLRFMLGEWAAVEGSGQPGEAVSGVFTLAFDLGDKVLVRRNRADYAPKPGEEKGISHQDLMIVYRLAGEIRLRAFYVDDEGHAINYLVSSPKENVAVFETDAAEHGPRFRLDYQLNPDRTLSITFSIAPPGGSYKVYTKGTARRKRENDLETGLTSKKMPAFLQLRPSVRPPNRNFSNAFNNCRRIAVVSPRFAIPIFSACAWLRGRDRNALCPSE